MYPNMYAPYQTGNQMQQATPVQTPSYLVMANNEIKRVFNTSTDQLALMEDMVANFCRNEYGKYDSKRFASFAYTALVAGMTKGQLAGIKPDISWYNPNFIPPKEYNEWVKNEVPINNQEVSKGKEDEVVSLKQEMESMRILMEKMMKNVNPSVLGANTISDNVMANIVSTKAGD